MRRADSGGAQVVERSVAIRDGVDRVGSRRVEAEVLSGRLAVKLPVEPRESA